MPMPWSADPRPGAGAPRAPAPLDAQACRALMRGGSKSFHAASLLLPGRVCRPAAALYAFCRLADDAIDLSPHPHQAVQDLRNRLDTVYGGPGTLQPADAALVAVVGRHGIPRGLLDALIEGFLWDAEGRRYESLDDLLDYAARVAGTVGAMMALVMGVRERDALARACELGLAMQLTNIARDVGEDARNGRLYLPLRWLSEAGIDPDAFVEAPAASPALADTVSRLLQVADGLYRRAEQGIARLPRDCRAAIMAARLIYAEIGRQLERDGLDPVARRAVVPARRKLMLLGRAGAAAWRPVAMPKATLPGRPAALPSVAGLVELALASAPRPVWPRNFPERVGWVLELFERRLAQQRAAP